MQGSPHLVKTGRLQFSLSWLKGKVTEILVYFRKASKMFEFLSTPPHVLPFTKQTCCIDNLKKGYNEQIWNKTLNIKPCMGQISGTFYMNIDYWRKKMIIGEKYGLTKTNLCLLAGIGQFHWNQVKKSPISTAWCNHPPFLYDSAIFQRVNRPTKIWCERFGMYFI